MKTLFLTVLAASLLACETAPPPATPAPPSTTASKVTVPTKAPDPLAGGRGVAAAFGRQEDLWARFAPSMKELFGNDPAGYAAFAAKAATDLGAERELVTERVDDDGVYHRVARFTKIGQPRKETPRASPGRPRTRSFRARSSRSSRAFRPPSSARAAPRS